MEPWKDHDTRELVTRLTECGERFGHTEQLRERIAAIVRPVADRLKQTSEPVAWAPRAAIDKLLSQHNNAPCVLTDRPGEFNDVPLYIGAKGIKP